MIHFFILILVIISLLFFYKKINKYLLPIIVCTILIVYYNKSDLDLESFQTFNKNDSVLKFHDKLKYLNDNDITKEQYETDNDLKIVIDGDSISTEPNDADSDFIEEEAPNRVPLKYGDVILIQCYAMEGKYLTGNRDGFNSAIQDGEGMESVFTTDEDKQLLEWTIMPYNNKNKMNSNVLYGDNIMLHCKHPIYDKFLIGGQTLSVLPYNIGETKCGVYTRSSDQFPDQYSDHVWELVSDYASDKTKVGIPVFYDEHLYIKKGYGNGSDDKYLSGARAFGYHNGSKNQQVYTVSSDDGLYENMWLIKQQKEPRIMKNDIISIFEKKGHLLEGKDASNYIKQYNTNNPHFGKNIYSIIDNNIIKNINKIKNINDVVPFEKFVTIDLQELHNVKSLFIKHNTLIGIKIAKETGIFHDVDLKFIDGWKKDQNEIGIKNNAGAYLNFDKPKVSFETPEYIDTGNKNLNPEFKFTVNIFKDNFYITKDSYKDSYVLTTDGFQPVMKEYNGLDIPKRALLKGDTNWKNINDEKIFATEIQVKHDTYVEVPINEVLQFFKLYLSQTDTVQTELYFTDKNDKKIVLDRTKPGVKTNNNEDITDTNTINTPLYTNTGEKSYIEVDLKTEKFVNGGRLIDSNTVTKIKVFYANGSKSFKLLGVFENNRGNTDLEFLVKKKNVQYIKLIIEDCRESNCKFKLTLY